MRFRAAGAAVVRIRSSRVAGRFADLIHQRMLFLEDAGKAANRASATGSAASACRRSSGITHSDDGASRSSSTRPAGRCKEDPRHRRRPLRDRLGHRRQLLALRGRTAASYGIGTAALNVLTAGLAAELGDTAILVNATCPGHTATGEGAEGMGARPIPACRGPPPASGLTSWSPFPPHVPHPISTPPS